MGWNGHSCGRGAAIAALWTASAWILSETAAADVSLPLEDETGDVSSTCGSGRIYLGETVVFDDRIDFTIRLTNHDGYLLDCQAGIDAYFEFQFKDDGLYVYAAWGQVGDNSALIS